MVLQPTNSLNLKGKMKKEKRDHTRVLLKLIKNKINLTLKIIKTLIVLRKMKRIKKSSASQSTRVRPRGTKIRRQGIVKCRAKTHKIRTIQIIILLNKLSRITNSIKTNKQLIIGLQGTKTKNTKNLVKN